MYLAFLLENSTLCGIFSLLVSFLIYKSEKRVWACIFSQLCQKAEKNYFNGHRSHQTLLMNLLSSKGSSFRMRTCILLFALVSSCYAICEVVRVFRPGEFTNEMITAMKMNANFSAAWVRKCRKSFILYGQKSLNKAMICRKRIRMLRHCLSTIIPQWIVHSSWSASLHQR